jgi:hypothetical protein
MAKIILRVDDCGWTPDKDDDRGLEYFRRWRDEFGIAGHPVYYGFIPTTLGMRELAWLRDNLRDGEQVSVHGWDHVEGPVKRADMAFGLDLFRAAELCDLFRPTYIPPWNRYDAETLKDWRAVSMWTGPSHTVQSASAIFGGFPGDPQSMNFGDAPCYVEHDLLHLPATRELYDRAGPVADRFDAYSGWDMPLVVTLHATWDAKNLGALRTLLKKIEPHLVTIDAAAEWVAKQG